MGTCSTLPVVKLGPLRLNPAALTAKWGREEVSKLVNDTLCSEVCKDLFNETLDSLIENQFIKCNIISSQECLSLPKDPELHHRSVQSTKKTAQSMNI